MVFWRPKLSSMFLIVWALASRFTVALLFLQNGLRDPEAGPHRRRNGHAADIFPLRGRRLGMEDGLDVGPDIVHQLLLRERDLPDRGMKDGGLVDAEFDLAGLRLVDGLLDIKRHCPGFGI